MKKLGKILINLIIIFSVVQNTVLAEKPNYSLYPDVFAKENVHIAPDQVIGRLILENGNATVEGTVTKGIVTAGGTLFITKTAHIEGAVLVIGGTVFREEGSHVAGKVWTLPAGPLTKMSTFVPLVLILAIAIIVAIFLAVWFGWKYFKKSAFYPSAVTLLKRWPVLYTAAALFSIGLMLAIFLDLSWQTLFKHTMDFFDNVMILLIRYPSSPILDRVMIVISSLGYGYFYVGLVAIVLLVLSLYRKWAELIALSLCFAGGAFLDFLLKHLFERARPDMMQVVHAGGYSFPSGHAMVSLCFYGILAYLISRKILSWKWRIAVLIITFILVMLIGISRIYLGVHYPTDVAAGYAAGSAWLIFCIFLHAWREHGRKN